MNSTQTPIAHAHTYLWSDANFIDRWRKLHDTDGGSPRDTNRATGTEVGYVRPDMPPVRSLLWLVFLLGLACFLIRYSPQIGAVVAWAGGL